MPENSLSTPSTTDGEINENTKNTPEELKNTALNSIEELSKPKEAIVLPSSLPFIIRKNSYDQSYFDVIADKYMTFNKSLWMVQRIGIVVLAIALAALIGFAFSAIMATVFAIIALSLYLVVDFFLTNHNTVREGRESRISQDILNMEKNLTESLALLVDTEQQVRDLVIKLHELNVESAKKLQSFEEQISALTTLTENYSETIRQLEQLKDSLVRDNEIITTQLHNASMGINQSKTDIEQGATTLNHIAGQLDKTNNCFQARDKELIDFKGRFDALLTSMDKLESTYNEQLTIIQTRIEHDKEDTEMSVLSPAEEEVLLQAKLTLQARRERHTSADNQPVTPLSDNDTTPSTSWWRFQ